MSQILTATDIPATGVLAPTLVAATDTSLKCRNDGRSFIIVLNGSGSPITATLKAKVLAATDDAIADADKAVTIAAAAEKWISSGRINYYDDGGYFEVVLSDTTTVTVAAMRVPDVL